MLVSEVLAGAKTLLGDSNSIFFTDDVLIPYVKEAHSEIQNDLILNGFRPFEVISIVINIPANTKEIPVPPADLFLVQKIEEANPGGTDWMEMMERSWEPNVTPSTILQFWAFRGYKVQFVGCTQSRDIKLYYLSQNAGVVGSAASNINLTNALPVYSSRVAYLAAQFKGRNKDAAKNLQQLYLNRLIVYLGIEVKSQQGVTYRRRPYTTKRWAIT
jgi:hypothetical protein